MVEFQDASFEILYGEASLDGGIGYSLARDSNRNLDNRLHGANKTIEKNNCKFGEWSNE
jgi:hypothetical protein